MDRLQFSLSDIVSSHLATDHRCTFLMQNDPFENKYVEGRFTSFVSTNLSSNSSNLYLQINVLPWDIFPYRLNASHLLPGSKTNRHWSGFAVVQSSDVG
mmetsp:Transcript_9377/g.22236  ORF Transcript_9377/g.22236 Transcript_9377/m.22236 type:complete len:99 (-) Transcript_9377:858-1154(-)